MKLTFLGHAAVLIESKESRIFIDPFVTDNPSCPLKIDEIPAPTHILVTHGHGDHLGDSVELSKRFGSLVVANFEIATYLSTKNVEKIHAMHIGGKTTFEFGSVKMVPAVHGSGIVDGDTVKCGGTPCGFLLETEGKKIYHAGDTGLTVEMQLLRSEKIDLAFLPIGGNYVMDVDDAVRAVEMIKPAKVVPMHYGTWPVIEANPEEFKERIETLGVECIIMKPGDTLEL
ncbi:MAG: metal-dependent hydrolase [Thermotogae bacterium]|nr:MAG: metal-dependent hydrolase [Thermotogota bacterium]